MKSKPTSERTRVRRVPGRGVYDRPTIDSILDAALVCHVGFVADGQAYVIPTNFARDGDRLLIHGSTASRMIRAASGGGEVCVTVTHVDGLVLARSAFHHSMNYRSVMVFGRARRIDDAEEKLEAMRLFVESLLPGRWDECRPPTEKEMAATAMLEVPIDEASAKVRTGPPVDDEEDYALPVWAGVLPLALQPGAPEPDPKLAPGIALPDSVARYKRPPGSG